MQVTTVAFSKAAQKAAKAQLTRRRGRVEPDARSRQAHPDAADRSALVLFFAWRAIKRAEANRVPLRVPLDLRELEAADTRALEPRRRGAATRRRRTDARSQPAADPAIEGEITDLIERQPDEVAQTLRSWLADRRT